MTPRAERRDHHQADQCRVDSYRDNERRGQVRRQPGRDDKREECDRYRCGYGPLCIDSLYDKGRDVGGVGKQKCGETGEKKGRRLADEKDIAKPGKNEAEKNEPTITGAQCANSNCQCHEGRRSDEFCDCRSRVLPKE